MKVYTTKELMALPRGDQIVDLLKAAALYIEAKQPERAAWRLADAALLLERRLSKAGWRNLEGYDIPTNRGAVLNAVSDY